MKDLLRPSDIVRRLGTSRSWVYQAAKNGDIPAIRLAGEDGPLRFVEQDVESWIEDARARWRPGRPAVATRPPPQHRRRPQTATPRSNRRAPSAPPDRWTQLELEG